MLLTALAYATAGWLALWLAIPPSFASPLYPGAGIALAAALAAGPRVLPGVALGAWVVNAILAGRPDATLWTGWGVPAVMAVGAAAQAALGAGLIRRWLPGPLTLAEPRQVALFFLLGGPVACLLNASLSTATMAASGLLPVGASNFTWWTWWAGDTLGVLIAAPAALTLVGRPRVDWAGRRITVGLPLLVTTLLLAGAISQVARWDAQRQRSVFDRDAGAAAQVLQSRLQRALYALEAMHGVFVASSAVSADEMRLAAAPWLRQGPQIQGLGHAERVPRTQLPAWEARVRQADQRALRVFDRPTADGTAPAAQDADVLAIRYLEPVAGANATALGVNVLSVPAARAAALRSAATGRAAATEGFRLTQETADQTGVVVYQALGNGTAGDWRAMQFVTLRMDATVAAALAEAPAYLHWCLIDRSPGASRRRLAGPPGCETTPAVGLQHQQPFEFAGRQWHLQIHADPVQVPDSGQGNTWLFSMVGLLAASVLAALLLTVTGRARRIEAAVDERTADLQREVAERQREVAERQRTEAALRESEQRFRNIFDHAPVGIAYADLQGQLREANPRLRELLGYEGNSLGLRALADLAPAEDHAAEAQALARLLAGELPAVRRRTRLKHRNGQLLSVQMGWSVLRDASGAPQRLVVVVEDITDQLKRQEAEQGRQVAESANRAKNEFLSRMSHELRTPLNAMLGFGQLLELDRQPALAAHQAGWVNHILQAGWHLLEMINDTLDLSRIDAGMLRLQPAAVDLPPLLAQCLALVQPSADKRGITLSLHIAPDASTAWGDGTRLKQVMINLLSNAVKYNIDGGSVRVQVRRQAGQRLEIRVHDTGLGLSAEQMANLFQPFNRLGREQGHIEGTGIGLVISRRLAELMGGSLRAESTAGEGAVFTLSLPAGQPATGPASPGLAESTGAQRYHRREVLYIEDNDTNVEVMRGILAQRPQVQLTVAGSGRAGLAHARATPPDLVLLDMHLPDTDGLDVLRALKQDPACAHIPVLAVSADATPARVNEALALGALHYLSKPLALGAFLSLIDEVLEEVDTQYGDLPPG